MKSPIHWYGGKTRLASDIVKLIPEHTHYVEPYFGSGAVLFAKPPDMVENHSEIVNDIYLELTQFYMVLRDKELFPEFMRLVSLTPVSEVEWHAAYPIKQDDSLMTAVKFFIRYKQSMLGDGRRFGSPGRRRLRGGMQEAVSRWLSAVDSLPESHARLQRVMIYCRNALDVILAQDTEQTFFYLDPPYLQDTRTAPIVYQHEAPAQHHVELLSILGELSGKFILSGYLSTLYEEAEKRYGWRRVEIPVACHAGNTEDKTDRVEVLWMNF